MKLAVGQMEPIIADIEENLIRVKSILNDASKTDVDVLVLPELCNSGYVFKSKTEVFDTSEEIPKGPVSKELISWSKDSKLAVAGICERMDELIYNSAAVFSCGEHIATYKKIHLYLNEKDWFQAGSEEPLVIEHNGYRFGIMICFDWMFPEITRILALKGAQVILHPANLVLPFCQDAMVTRSIENRVFTATANRIGTERGVSFTGLSQITDTKGNKLVRMNENTCGVESVGIDPLVADDKAITARNDILSDRRPDLYRRLTLAD